MGASFKEEKDAGRLVDETMLRQAFDACYRRLSLGQVRVRMKDATGRWSHWSQPCEFTVAYWMAGTRPTKKIARLLLKYRSPWKSCMNRPQATSKATLEAGTTQ